jgi:hypothetical protein
MPTLLLFALRDMSNGVQTGDVISRHPADHTPTAKERALFGFLYVSDAEPTDPEIDALFAPKRDPGIVIAAPDVADRTPIVRHRARQLERSALPADVTYRPQSDSRRASVTRAQLAGVQRDAEVRAPQRVR